MSDSRTVTEWRNCYDDSWQGVIVPDAFAHPAKFAPGLAYRIYKHLLDSGYIAPGDKVIDPFGGIGGGGYHALLLGLHWMGVELEPRFVELGNRNIDKWRRDLAMLNGTLGTARLLQGDSRRLLEVVGVGAAGCVSSPPYIDSVSSTNNDLDWEKFANPDKYRPRENAVAGNGVMLLAYGSTPGQLGSMPPGSFDSAVSSPPYSDMIDGQGEGPGARYDPIYHNGDNAYKQSSANGYGTTPGNLGSMAGEGFEAAVADAVVSSPPFEDGVSVQDTKFYAKKCVQTGRNPDSPHAQGISTYGNDPGNIGHDQGETFWTAARVIVAQTYTVLKPGGYAAWVTKRFIRKGQIVEFSDQWEALCAAVGFVSVERIHALLVEAYGEQLDIFGGATARRKERKSFFRRLAEKNGSPRIDHEDVIIMRKPQ